MPAPAAADNHASAESKSLHAEVAAIFPPSRRPDSPATASLITHLTLAPHPEGGFFRRLHASSYTTPAPYPSTDPATRLASSSIHYLLTPSCPIGHFHRNRSLTYHFWHRGRGRYILISESGEVETFVVGGDVAAGERAMWVAKGGRWKCSFIEESEQSEEGDGNGEGLWISEVVVPAWEERDHEFLGLEGLRALVGEEQAGRWSGFVRGEKTGGGEEGY